MKQFIARPRSTGTIAATLLAAGVSTASAQQAPPQEQTQSQELEEVVVTGFRQSLQDSTEAKRDSVGFVDAIFAEDIGKFPDTNIAESFQRIPGIQISREISGEGTTVAIRGLNTNFTRVLLNNAPVAVATAPQEGSGANREVPLDMFPPELFSKLEVFKTPTANMVEGGAAGTINMRMARPFDTEGPHLTYSLQGTDNSNADDLGGRAALIASNTWDRFGVLAGVTAVRNQVATTGFESVGWANLALTPEQCGTSPCNTTQGNGPGTAPTVPTNASTIAAGLAPGTPVNQAFLLANNPGRTIRQIDNAVIPRLGRTMFEEGDRDRYNAVVSMEFRASENMQFFLDSMYGKQESDFHRQATAWAIRAGSQGGRPIPTQLQVDRDNCDNGCVATSGVFPNSQFMLEFRPYIEDSEFWGTNPGMTWQIAEKWNLDVQGNYTKSKFSRQASTALFISDTTTVNFDNPGGDTPTITSSVDLNDPNSWQWLVTDRGGTDVGRVNLQDEKRETETTGARFALTWGDTQFSISGGAAYDEVSRDIRPFAADAQWQAQVCGGNPGNFQVNPNGQPGCRGETAGEIAPILATPGQTTYPAYAGPYGGSLVPNAAVPGFLHPSRYGVATVDWDALRRASNYDATRAAAPEAGSTPSTANWGSIEEDVTAVFAQVNGDMDIGEQRLRYNVGVRYVETDQLVTSRLTFPNPANTPATPDGQRQADLVNIVPRDSTYENWLPSANVSFNLTDKAIVRAGLSKTMTRANPTDMLLGLSIRNADVSQVDLGNPELKPYVSDNVDLGFEYYTSDEGYFGAAAFRKGIDGFTQRQSQFIPFSDLAQYGVTLDTLAQQQRDAVEGRGGNSAIVELRQTVNASGRLTINGLEFNWVQPLGVLVGALDGLGFAANYTIIDQKGEGAAPAIAIGVPPESYNATIYYDKHGISARISVTHSQGSQSSGPNSNQSGVVGAELFGDDYTQYDFSSSFDFTELFGWPELVPQLTLDVVNIDEEPRRSYQQFANAPYSYFESGRVVMVGLRGRFD
ncbi:TonB-dependent receptor [Steroidobacter agaridevorans]|uniref:TonB-dependent receptor n=1 Tax=Steroidobacter agaridevorans TaxID=2695856 RepID=A0A829YL67_9GAMM|nr:TonB-dependent receptor [Steroidobacter agaridevorans]GFE83562.1 TonB-dependent receptor [Steroidobacter agaridevorans]